jgi:hypothetical protein
VPEEQRDTAGKWLYLATQDYIMFKNRSSLDYIRRLGVPLGSTVNPP